MEILRGSLKVLDRSLRRLAPLFKGAASSHDALKRSIHSRPRLSAKARVAMVLQGRYMGYMRQLKPRQKAQVRKIREAKGVRAAIVRAREITRG
jgi:hypothetical protein